MKSNMYSRVFAAKIATISIPPYRATAQYKQKIAIQRRFQRHNPLKTSLGVGYLYDVTNA